MLNNDAKKIMLTIPKTFTCTYSNQCVYYVIRIFNVINTKLYFLCYIIINFRITRDNNYLFTPGLQSVRTGPESTIKQKNKWSKDQEKSDPGCM